MPIVPLTKGFVACVDAEDFATVSKHNWHAHPSPSGKTVYAATYIKGRRVLLHHFVKPGFARLDHRDLDGLNNRKRNLRPATKRQNQANRSRQANNTSGYKGVYWHKAAKKWAAKLKHSPEQFHLGLFSSAEAAARAYDRAARKAWGSFARLNFPCAR